MKQGRDIVAGFPGITIIHQKIRGYSVGGHRHDEHELFLPLQGEIRIETSGAELKAGTGKMIYLPPQVPHSFMSSSSSQGERIIFMLETKAWKANGGGRFEASVISTSQLCKELLFHLLLHPRTKAAPALIQTLVQTISEMLEASGPRATGGFAHLEGHASDDRIRKALAVIREKFNQPLSMAALARSGGLSTRNLNRLFLLETGMTPKQAITLFRIESAQRLLERQRLSVTDVAFETGYASVSQFISTFRKVTGRLPSEWQRS